MEYDFSKTPALELEALFKRHFTQVVFFKGTAMSTRDLERVKVRTVITFSYNTVTLFQVHICKKKSLITVTKYPILSDVN